MFGRSRRSRQIEIDIDFQFQATKIPALEESHRAMIVCHCNGVSDRTIRRVAREGSASVADVGFACGAGTCCGGCIDAIRQIIHSESSGRKDAPAPNAPAIAASA